MYAVMARAATTSDVFNAIAEPRRRDILTLLRVGRAHAVGELVRALRLPQPAVSKHLGVLRRAGLVSASRQGRRRLYRINAHELKPVHDWTATFERYWSHQLDRIKEQAQRKAHRREG